MQEQAHAVVDERWLADAIAASTTSSYATTAIARMRSLLEARAEPIRLNR